MDTALKHPFTLLCAGPSNSGKSTWVKNFLKYRDRMCSTSFSRIIFYYAEWQPLYETLDENVSFQEGLPHSTDFANDLEPKLLIIDDFMREASNKVIIDLFVKSSHHRNLSVIFITQNLFHKGQRDISLNVSYLVVFRNLRDRSQINTLARQIFPENSAFIKEIFKEATSKPHSYLLFDLTQATSDDLRFRTSIFPCDGYECVYVPKKRL